MILFNWLEVWVFHRIFRSYALSVVILEHHGEEVESLICAQGLVGRVYEFTPLFLWEITKLVIVVAV
jgi:hypothetical protein